jgi:ketosteroid isomerase-like protein
MRFLTLALLLASCSKEDAPPDVSASKHAIWETIKAYHDAGDKGNVADMAAFLAPEITLSDGLEDFIRGKDEAMKKITDRVKMYEGQRRATILGREVINITGDVAVVTYVASVGPSLRSGITAVLRRSQGKWLISHIHENWQPHNK